MIHRPLLVSQTISNMNNEISTPAIKQENTIILSARPGINQLNKMLVLKRSVDYSANRNIPYSSLVKS
jgi:hypothetical protein